MSERARTRVCEYVCVCVCVCVCVLCESEGSIVELGGGNR